MYPNIIWADNNSTTSTEVVKIGYNHFIDAKFEYSGQSVLFIYVSDNNIMLMILWYKNIFLIYQLLLLYNPTFAKHACTCI